MLLLGVLFLMTLLIGGVLSALFHGLASQFESDDTGPSLGRREWRAPAAMEPAAAMTHARRPHRVAALVE